MVKLSKVEQLSAEERADLFRLALTASGYPGSLEDYLGIHQFMRFLDVIDRDRYLFVLNLLLRRPLKDGCAGFSFPQALLKLDKTVIEIAVIYTFLSTGGEFQLGSTTVTL